MGLSHRILKPIQTMYGVLRRRWKLASQSVGAEWSCTNGILQGCGVSVVLLNALVTVWLQAVSAETASEAEVKPGGYADDIHAVTKTVQGVKQVIGITCEYAGLSGQEVSHQKSSTFAVTLPQRKKLSGVKLDGHKLAVQSNVDILGFTLVMSQAKKGSTGKTAKATKGADKSKKRLQRLCYAPLHFEAKVCRNWRLVSSDLWPRRQTSSCRCFELSSQGGSARHRERCWQSFMCRSCFHALCQGS